MVATVICGKLDGKNSAYVTQPFEEPVFANRKTMQCSTSQHAHDCSCSAGQGVRAETRLHTVAIRYLKSWFVIDSWLSQFPENN